MPFNMLAVVVAALVPMIVGAIWYNEKVFGRAWMNASGVTDDMVRSGNMAAIMGFSLVFAFMLAFFLAFSGVVIHQAGLTALFLNSPEFGKAGTPTMEQYEALMAQFGDTNRNFGHGALHGAVASILFALPIIGIISLFERRGWRYRLIQGGYWMVTLMIMGAIICGWK